jgi:glycosyltransferase involved in cell wall biosynthesis
MKISIVTPCLNQSKFIVEAVESVLEQEYPNLEHIIVDGGSTDGTLEELRRYPHLTVMSGPDRNLYDAFNKGLRSARGDIIGHLNGDDVYPEGVFCEVAEAFRRNTEVEAVCGNACVFEEDGLRVRKSIGKYYEIEHKRISFESALFSPPLINAKFFRKSVYEKHGGYNDSYSISADREFLLRLAVRGLKEMVLSRVIYCYRKHVGSLTFDNSSAENIERRLEEKLAICEDYAYRFSSTKKIRHLLGAWHTSISLKQFFLLLPQARYPELLKCAVRGIRYDALWLARFSQVMIGVLGGKFAKGRPSMDRKS